MYDGMLAAERAEILEHCPVEDHVISKADHDAILAVKESISTEMRMSIEARVVEMLTKACKLHVDRYQWFKDPPKLREINEEVEVILIVKRQQLKVAEGQLDKN